MFSPEKSLNAEKCNSRVGLVSSAFSSAVIVYISPRRLLVVLLNESFWDVTDLRVTLVESDSTDGLLLCFLSHSAMISRVSFFNWRFLMMCQQGIKITEASIRKMHGVNLKSQLRREMSVSYDIPHW